MHEMVDFIVVRMATFVLSVANRLRVNYPNSSFLGKCNADDIKTDQDRQFAMVRYRFSPDAMVIIRPKILQTEFVIRFILMFCSHLLQ